MIISGRLGNVVLKKDFLKKNSKMMSRPKNEHVLKILFKSWGSQSHKTLWIKGDEMSVQTGFFTEEEGSQLNPHQAEENLPVRRQELLCSAISNPQLAEVYIIFYRIRIRHWTDSR